MTSVHTMVVELATDVCSNDSNHTAKWIAKKIPLQEINDALDYYDSHKFPVQIDELAFVNNLMRKYSTDRLTIIKRIRQVRMIKLAKKQEIKVKNRKK
jgi:hypothetical protein